MSLRYRVWRSKGVTSLWLGMRLCRMQDTKFQEFVF